MDDVKQEASRLINTLLGADRRDRWKFAFRASAMPACQLQFVWLAMDQRLGTQPWRKQSYIGDFYMNVGTAIHAATQRWLGRLGLLFGNWACGNVLCQLNQHDDNGELIPAVRRRFGPQRCPECRRELVYSEFSFRDEPTGHCDGLVKLGGITPADLDFALLEIKTAGKARMQEFLRDGPPLSYKLQAIIYCHKLNAMGFNVRGVLFLFIPRDDPQGMQPIWYPIGPKKAANIHASIIDGYEAVKKALSHGGFEGISGACVEENDAYNCPYRVVCFSPDARSMFQDKFRKYTTKLLDTEGIAPVETTLPLMPGDRDAV